MDVNLSGFGGGQTAVDWDDPAIFEVHDDAALASRLFTLLTDKTTWPSLTEAKKAASTGQGWRTTFGDERWRRFVGSSPPLKTFRMPNG